MLMTPEEYRESLRALSPTVYINGDAVSSVADEPLLTPGVNGIALTYELALHQQHSKVMSAVEQENGLTVNRFAHINRTSQDLLDKLEATRLACQYAGGSPAAMEMEILRNYPVPSKQDLVQRLLDRRVLAVSDDTSPDKDPGRCCATGCDTGLPGPKRSYY